ncbi:MAG: hypothetical protein HUJ65_06645 [Oscillospiraceae bacterium]|nr:hypothetical protein [Oscillospiraceae bacterium]
MELKHGLISVEGKTYGGNQLVSENRTVSRCGCGAVSALELFSYLHRNHADGKSKMFAGTGETVTAAQFETMLRSVRKYIPIVYPLGINGVFLSAGVDAYMLANRLPYRARWCVGGRKIWQRIDEMLAADIPAIISAGPRLVGAFADKELLRLRDPVTLRHVQNVRAHYMTVTASDNETITVSSWGKRFKINKREYEEYAAKQSGYLVSNVLYLRRIRQGRT